MIARLSVVLNVMVDPRTGTGENIGVPGGNFTGEEGFSHRRLPGYPGLGGYGYRFSLHNSPGLQWG